MLSESIDNVVVECVIFPAYETKGELVSLVRKLYRFHTNQKQTEAVAGFADWLTTQTVEREVANGSGGGAGKAKIVLCGHRHALHIFSWPSY